MKIVIAPNAFKGSLTAAEVAASISTGVKRVFPDAEIDLLPIADGGDGTLELVLSAAAGQRIEMEVRGPLGAPVRAAYGLLPGEDTAVIEMAAASGLRLLSPAERDPLRATTYGTGQLMKAALDRGCTRIIIGVGGSATVDGGCGMAQALGVRLLDADGQDIPPGGAGLQRLARVDLSGRHERINQAEIVVACDVENPLVGPQGAAPVFGPQKGADAEMVAVLAQALELFAEIVARDTGKRVAEMPGAGAAGGLAAGLVAFTGARLESGTDTLLALMDMERHIRAADLVITGEGQIDGQTAYGKAPIGVARMAQRHGVPVIGLAGGLGQDAAIVYDHGIDALASTVPGPITLEQAMSNAARLIEDAAERALRLVRIGQRLD
jgi:glycerate 2-kinase